MNPAPPKISPSNSRLGAIALVVIGVAVAAMVYFFNPSSYGIYPVCQFHQLTGLNCPGCGGTRALYALLHGHFSVALHDNVLFVFGAVAAAVRGVWFGLNHLRGRPNGQFFQNRFLLPVLAVVALFTVLRNLPAFAFLSP